MTLSADDMSSPLGQDTVRKPPFRLPFSAPVAISTITGLFLVTFVGFALFNDDPLGGEPLARIAITPPTAPEQAATAPAAKESTTPAPDISGQKTVTIIDGSSGNQRNVVIGGEPAAAATDTPALMTGINPKLLASSRYGMVPIAADGLKPVTAYAMGSDADLAKALKMPSIAIIVGGLGIGATKTTEAILRLPAAVTLAFTPYGSEPGKLVERARAQRHEVLLQIPMEPFDYPDNDPGPQTLLATASGEQNLDRMLWHLSRFQGYVGVGNFMGARFVATDAAMQPIIRDAGKRGLAYFDDGSAPRSVAGAIAEGSATPYLRSDIGIDAIPTSADIDSALAKLEQMARQRGVAVGTASALPVSIERIAAFAKGLESRGILLVPITVALQKVKAAPATAAGIR